jgi:hypothetical protein
MEDSMCWEMDYDYIAEQQMAQKKRAETIDKLLNEAKLQGQQQAESAKVQDAAVKEIAPAK